MHLKKLAMSVVTPIDGVIGRANLWIAEDFGCVADAGMTNGGDHARAACGAACRNVIRLLFVSAVLAACLTVTAREHCEGNRGMDA